MSLWRCLMGLNVIIPAAGEATRLRPITSNMSKAMVPINGKPVIDYILEYLEDYDIAQIVIVHGKNQDLPEYIKSKHGSEIITLCNQRDPCGPANAIWTGSLFINNRNNPCVVWLGDTIIREKLPLGNDFIAVSESVEDQSEWCIFDGNHFYNKPEHNINNGKALIGLYSFSDGITFDCVFDKDMLGAAVDNEISDIISTYNKPLEPISVDEWYDMGNFRTYYDTSAKLLSTKARAFNDIKIDTFYGTLTKSSMNEDILVPEIKWYDSLNEKQKLFVPTIIESSSDDCKNWTVSSRAHITMTLETGILLSDLLVYDNLPITTWDFILDKIFKIMHEVFYKNDTKNTDKINNMYIGKTVKRLKDIDFFTRSEYNQLINLSEELSKDVKWSSIIHGDLHTGNILFEPISGKMKLIDPRGDFGGIQPSPEGDRNYDMYKLAHDLYWGYNHLVAGLEHNREDIKELFCKKLNQYGYNVNNTLKGGLLLLATCIPLHDDDYERQKRFEKVVKDNL